jgi:hypothetical protein
MALPIAQFLTQLTIDAPSVDGTFMGRVLGERAPATLRTVRLGPASAWSGLRDVRLAALGAVWPRVPRLREVTIHGRPESLGPIVLPELRRARIHLEAGTDPAVAERIVGEVARAEWPALEQLSLWHGGSPASLRAALDRSDLVTLGDLTVANCAFGDLACELVAASPLAAQLHRLSLEGGALSDDGATALLRAARAGAFPSLAVLDLSETHVSRAALDALRAHVEDVRGNGNRTGPLRIAIPALAHDPDE